MLSTVINCSPKLDERPRVLTLKGTAAPSGRAAPLGRASQAQAHKDTAPHIGERRFSGQGNARGRG